MWLDPPYNNSVKNNGARLEKHSLKQHKLYVFFKQKYIESKLKTWQKLSIVITEKLHIHHTKLIEKLSIWNNFIYYMGETIHILDRIWSLKLSIIATLPSYLFITKRCQLCLYKKYAIITNPDPKNLLNKRSENMSKSSCQKKLTEKLWHMW